MGSYCERCDEKMPESESGICEKCEIIESDNKLLRDVLDNIDSALTQIDSDCSITAHEILTTTYYKIEKYLKE